MSEEDFIQLIKDLFKEINIKNLYEVKIMKNGKVKIVYNWKLSPNVMCNDIIERRY